MRALMRGGSFSVAVAGFALLASCGASTRMVHQSAYYFERCHAADLDGQRTVDERQACWAAWLRHWSGAQPPVRVRYAEQRLAALSRGEAMAPLPQNEGSGAVGLADEPMGGTQVLVDASGGAGPPQIELTPGPDAEPTTQLEASVATGTGGTAETAETAAAPVAPSGVGEEAEVSAEAPNGYTPPRPAPPPPPVRDPVPPPPPRPPIPAGAQPCTDLCNPRWDMCVRACGARGAPCQTACRSEYRVCMGACR